MEWISVKDRLPDTKNIRRYKDLEYFKSDQLFIIYMRGKEKLYGVAKYIKDVWDNGTVEVEWKNENENVYYNNVIQWAIPEPQRINYEQIR